MPFTPSNIDGVVRLTRAEVTKHVPVQNADFGRRVINVTKRLDMADKTYSRLVYYSHLAHVDPQVRKLRQLTERYQKSTFEWVAQSFDRQFEDRLHKAEATRSQGILEVHHKSHMRKLLEKLHHHNK